ncbi:hypothetical protein FOA52_013155 [Chlamydomonas sp. UWO 241]|nr:hypothetical protein FOA52_013155 [Chlamydomonas sp. UWO 241]
MGFCCFGARDDGQRGGSKETSPAASSSAPQRLAAASKSSNGGPLNPNESGSRQRLETGVSSPGGHGADCMAAPGPERPHAASVSSPPPPSPFEEAGSKAVEAAAAAAGATHAAHAHGEAHGGPMLSPPIANPMTRTSTPPIDMPSIMGLSPMTSAASSLPMEPSLTHPSGNGHGPFSARALGPSLPQGATASVRPEELMLQPLDNLGLMARPASLQLHQLNREISNLLKIGQGAGGIVYRGMWTGVHVAIKFLKSSSPDQLNATAKEAILARFVSHPNVVQTYTYDVTLLVDYSSKFASGGQTSGTGNALPNALPGIPEAATDSAEVVGSTGSWVEQTRIEAASHTLLQPVGAAVARDSTSAQSVPLEADPVLEELDPGMGGQPDPDSGMGMDPEPGSLSGRLPATTTEVSAAVSAAAAQYAAHGPTTSASLGIFDRSTLDFRMSMVSQADGDISSVGWDMQDVLMRLGAETGEYLTHIIMELCDAGTLQSAISRGTFGGSKDSSGERAKCRAMLKAAREVSSGMQHLHSVAIIHGDLKPGNVLLKKEAGAKPGFIAKVGDFGLARRALPDGKVQVQSGPLLGTLCYAAPEALRGSLLKSSDVYSFGVLLWQMCSGLQPFADMHPAAILYGKQTGSIKLVWPRNVYSPIRKLGELCMEVEPQSRPNFDQVCKALQQIEARLKQTKKPPAATGAGEGGGGPSQVVYDLMPDPELL